MKKLILRLGTLSICLGLMIAFGASTAFAGTTPAITNIDHKNGVNRVLVEFNAPVWNDTGFSGPLAAADFQLGGTCGATSISSVTHAAGDDWAVLVVAGTIAADESACTIAAKANSIFTVGGALSEKTLAWDATADTTGPTMVSVMAKDGSTDLMVLLNEHAFSVNDGTGALVDADFTFAPVTGSIISLSAAADELHVAGNKWVVLQGTNPAGAGDLDETPSTLNVTTGVFDVFGNASTVGAAPALTAAPAAPTFTSHFATKGEATLGGTHILVKFSQPVFDNTAPALADLVNADFAYTDTTQSTRVLSGTAQQTNDQQFVLLTVDSAFALADLTDATADTINVALNAVYDAFGNAQAQAAIKLQDNTDPVILSVAFNQASGANTLAFTYSERVSIGTLTSPSATMAASTATVGDMLLADIADVDQIQGFGAFATKGNVTVLTGLNSLAIDSTQSIITITIAGGTNGYMASTSTTAPSGIFTPEITGAGITDLAETPNSIETTSVQSTITTTAAWDLTKPTILSALLTDSYINANTSAAGSDGRVDKLVLTASETLKAVSDSSDTRNDWTLTSNPTEFGTTMAVTSASAPGSAATYTLVFSGANVYYDAATFTLAAASDEWSLMDRAGNILSPTSKVCMSGYVCTGGTANYAVTTLTITKPDSGDTTPPAKPTGLTAEQDSDGNVKLSWTAPADADLSKVNIYRAKNGGALTGNIYAAISAGTSTYTDEDVVAGEVIEYAVKATDASNNASALTASVTITVEEVEAPAPVEPVTVTLSTQNASGQAGTATLTEADGKTTVTIATTGGPTDVDQPAHIHMGSCAELGDAKYTLTSVSNNASVTVLDMTIAELKAGLPLAINIHKSADESTVFYACGDILAAAVEDEVVVDDEEAVTDEEAGKPTPVAPTSGVFGDTASHWAKTEVAAMTKAGIIKGNPDGTFRPDNNINRAEVAILICRIAGNEGETTTKNPFPDVKAGAWYGGCVSALKTMGITKGNPDGTYNPTSDINRAEFLTLALRIYEKLVGGVTAETTTTAYTDLKTDWYTGNVATATKLGFVQGSTCGTGKCFYAEKPISRAEASTILYRMFKAYLEI